MLFHMHTHRKTSLNHLRNFHIVFAKAKHFPFQVLLKMHFISVLDCYSRGFFVSSVHWDGAFLLNDVFVLCSVSFKIWNFLVWLFACSDIFWGVFMRTHGSIRHYIFEFFSNFFLVLKPPGQHFEKHVL